jgi:hypothetical protein
MLRQAAAIDELHAEVMKPVTLTHFVDRHNMGMVQIRRRLRFVAKPLHFVCIRQTTGMNHLQGDHPVQASVPGLVNHSHAATTYLMKQFVVGK